MQQTILVISEHASQLQATEHALQQQMHYKTIACNKVHAAVEWLQSEKHPTPDAIILDIEPTGGMSAVMELKMLRPRVPLIVMIAYGEDRLSVESIKAGANDFLVKPISLGRLTVSLQNLLKQQRMSVYISWLERKIAGHMEVGDLVGRSPGFRQVIAQAKQAASSRMPVWVDGESGVGKESIARAIHGSSDRAGKPFIVVNCEMLPSHMAESILFGQEKSLRADKLHFMLGKVREADQGTLLLKEVGTLPADIQGKILEMVASGMVRPLGGMAIPVDVRLICTNTQPAQLSPVQNGFRQKLSALFKIFSISMPPLRDRKDDISLLANHFVTIHATSENKYVSGITEQALQWLQESSWDGNITQLCNMIWRAVILCTGDVIGLDDLQALQRSRFSYSAEHQPEMLMTNTSVLIDDQGQIKPLKSVEKEAIRFALQQANGCMTRAARTLGIGRSTLYRKVSDLSLDGGVPNGAYISRPNQTTRPMTKISSMERS